MKRPISQNWRLVYDYVELLTHLEHRPALNDRGSFLEFQIDQYRETLVRWRSVTIGVEGALPRGRLREFAGILDCDEDYDAVVDRAYKLNHTWKRIILPHVACMLVSLTELSRQAAESGYSRSITEEDLDALVDTHVFNVRMIMTDKPNTSPPEVRLAYLEYLQRYLIGMVSKGRLLITDPETGIELPPGDKRQAEFALSYIRNTLGMMIQETKQEVMFVAAGKKLDRRYSFEVNEPIHWLDSLKSLVALLEKLVQESLIGVAQLAIPSLIEQHFIDECA